MMSSYILASADQCVLMATRGRRFPGPSVFRITTEIHRVLDRDAALSFTLQFCSLFKVHQ